MCNAAKSIKKTLTDNGADVNARDKCWLTPLRIAIRNNDIDSIKSLIEDGANVNEQNKYGLPPLYEAISTNDVFIVGALVNAGAQVDVRNRLGFMPLDHYFMVVERGKLVPNPEIVSLLTPKTKAKL